VYARSARVIALSPGIQAALPEGKTVLVPNSADLDLFDPGAARGPFQVAYFGAMGEANDLTAVIEAARLVPDLPFDLMGDGKRRAELARGAPPNVRFGSGSKTDVARLAGESSACLTVFKDVPVLATNSPNKLFDTFAAGRAAIVNMDGWMRELVERNEAGVYVRAGDAADLAEKVAWLRDNPDETERMGRNARALAERDFGRDQLAGRALAVLEEAAR
jgi:glycosyltransferase involved in cell wall biosynthesis